MDHCKISSKTYKPFLAVGSTAIFRAFEKHKFSPTYCGTPESSCSGGCKQVSLLHSAFVKHNDTVTQIEVFMAKSDFWNQLQLSGENIGCSFLSFSPISLRRLCYKLDDRLETWLC